MNQKDIEQLKSDNIKLRRYLWINHGCSINALYGDDGEMQCSKCLLDFKRQSVDTLISAITEKNIKKFQKSLDSLKILNNASSAKDFNRAIDFAKKAGKDISVKNKDGDICGNISSAKDFNRAVDKAKKAGKDIPVKNKDGDICGYVGTIK